jgi:hypothetical protein
MEQRARRGGSEPEIGHAVPHSVDDDIFEKREDTRRKPIISINGEDVDEDDIGSEAA